MKIKWFNACKVPRGKLACRPCFINVRYEGYLCYYYWISVDLIFQNNAYFKYSKALSLEVPSLFHVTQHILISGKE